MDIENVYRRYLEAERKLFQNITYFIQNKDESLLKETLKIHPQIALYRDHCTNETLLHHVAQFGTIETANSLIQLGAEINAEDVAQRTPLYRAVEFNAEMVRFLLNNGANVTLSPNGRKLLQQALNCGSTDTVCLILAKMFPEFENLELMKNGQKCWEIVKFLIYHEIGLTSPGTNFSLLLFFILKNGDEEIFRLILENNVFNLDARCSFGHTMLHWAVELDKDHAVKCLLDMGADVNAEGSNGVTALHHAVRKRNPGLVSYLLARGANVNKTTRDEKYSPLHYSLVVDNDEIIETLLQAGADVKAKFGSPLENSSVLNLVCGCSSLRQRLCFSVGNSIDVNSLFSGRDLVFNKEKIKLLIEMGADVEVSEESYNGHELTPMQRACEAGRMDIVELLVSCGADVYSKNNEGMTMIHHAVLGMNLEIVEFLVERGLDVNAVDHFNRTPLYHLVKLNSNDVIPIIEFLVDHGADINICNKEEFSSNAGAGPLHLAVKQEQLNVIECLLHFQADMTIVNGQRERPLESSYSYTQFITRRSEILIAFMAMKNISINCVDEMDEERVLDTEGNRNMANYFYHKCQAEITKMKRKQICNDRNITYYDFLTKDLMRVTISARRGQILEILDLNKYQLEFPCYFFLLKKRIERVKSMLGIQNAVIHLLQDYSKIELPVVVVDKIIEKLSAKDFRNMARIMFR